MNDPWERESFVEINFLCAEHEVPAQISALFRHNPHVLKYQWKKTF